jgi:hypothetical protein
MHDLISPRDLYVVENRRNSRELLGGVGLRRKALNLRLGFIQEILPALVFSPAIRGFNFLGGRRSP